MLLLVSVLVGVGVMSFVHQLQLPKTPREIWCQEEHATTTAPAQSQRATQKHVSLRWKPVFLLKLFCGMAEEQVATPCAEKLHPLGLHLMSKRAREMCC